VLTREQPILASPLPSLLLTSALPYPNPHFQLLHRKIYSILLILLPPLLSLTLSSSSNWPPLSLYLPPNLLCSVPLPTWTPTPLPCQTKATVLQVTSTPLDPFLIVCYCHGLFLFGPGWKDGLWVAYLVAGSHRLQDGRTLALGHCTWAVGFLLLRFGGSWNKCLALVWSTMHFFCNYLLGKTTQFRNYIVATWWLTDAWYYSQDNELSSIVSPKKDLTTCSI
jgi:hypothetical protein